MGAAATAIRPASEQNEIREVTLLELVHAIGQVTKDDREVVATVLHLLRTGRVRLRGNFRGSPWRDLA